MSRADKLKNNLFYLVAGGVYTYALAAACLACTYIRLTDGRALAVALLAMAFFCLWFYNRHTFWIGLCLMLGSAFFTWLYLHTHDYEVVWFTRLPDLADLISHIRGLTGYYERYAVLGIVIIVGYALMTAAAIRSRGGFYLLSLVGFGVFGLISYLQYHISPTYLVCFLFVFATLLARRLSRSAARAGGDLAINVSGLLLLPICLVIIWIANGLPQPQAASSRSIRDNVTLNLSALDEFFYGTFSPKYFSFATTGFSASSGRLGGNVTPNERYIMEVYAPMGDKPYLAGAYKDIYRGDRWGWSQPESALPVFEAESPFADWTDVGGNDLMLERYASVVGMNGLKREPIWQELARSYRLLTVLPRRATRSVFAPAETMLARHWGTAANLAASQSGTTPPRGALSQIASALITIPESSLTFRRTSQGAVEAQSTMTPGTGYTVGYMTGEMHDMDSRLLYGTTLSLLGYEDADGQLNEALLPYLELPETLPQRVRDLAHAIVDEAGAENPYAKMKALEQYLHQFPYTLTPGPVPGEVDFVDYFLFEGQQGYCTYYATALAVMGRCVGVPTRYAEGYVLPQEQNEQGGYDVTNAQAHAWCEAFFSVAGWTAFEATAPYAQAFYNNVGETPAHDTYDALDYPGPDDFLEDALMAGVRDRDSQATDPAQAEEPEASPRVGRMGIFMLTLLGLGLAAAAVLGARYWLYQRRMRALEALPNREAALAYYRRILGLLSAQGVPLMPGETADTYGARLDGARGGGPHHRLATIFCRAAYSPHTVTDDDRFALAEGYRQLLAREGEALPQRAKAFMERYILGKY